MNLSRLLTFVPLGIKRFNSTKTVPPGCFLPLCGVNIVRAPKTSSEKCRVAAFLAKNYFPDEPLMKASGMKGTDPAILQYYLTLINEGMSSYAIVPDSREILGVAINSKNTLTTQFELKSLASRLATDESRRYMSMLAQIEERGNVYKSFLLDKVLTVEALAVTKRFRRRGIGQMLLEEAVRQAKTLQYPMVKIATGNVFAQQAALTCSVYKRHFSRPAMSFRDDAGKPWLKHELCPPHTMVEVHISDLRPKGKTEEKKEPTCDRYGLEKYDK